VTDTNRTPDRADAVLYRLLGLTATGTDKKTSQPDAIPGDAGEAGRPGVDTLINVANRDAVFAYILRRVRDRDLAEDLTQDVLSSLFEYAGKARIRNVRAFAFKVAENAIRSHFRRAGARPQSPLDDDLPLQAPTSEQIVIDRERLDLVRGVIGTLPPRRREVLVRLRIHGETHDEIAAAMGLSRAGVEKHLTRALASLRDALERTFDDAEGRA